MESMSANYNKIEGNQAVRVGNWYEEQELKAVTGQTRSAQWVAPSNANQQGDFEPMHTKLKGHPDMMDSTMRVFFHSDVRPRPAAPRASPRPLCQRAHDAAPARRPPRRLARAVY